MLIRDIGTRIISTLLGIRHPRPTLWRGGLKNGWENSREKRILLSMIEDR